MVATQTNRYSTNISQISCQTGELGTDSHPWEQRQLGEVGLTYPGLSGKTKEDFGHGDARFVTYMNVYSNAVANSDGVEAIEKDNRQHEVRNGDVFFTGSSETPDEVGLSSVWLGNSTDTYLNSFCFGYRPSKQLDSLFLAPSLRSPQMRSRIILLAQGISRFNISKTQVMQLPLGFPSLPEQRRIGEFFSTLDSLIAAAERQEALLRQKKQAYLQLMFPREGETEPRLRFAGFSGEWETRRFGEIFQYERPDAYLAGDDEIEDEGAIPVLTANKAFILGYTNSFQGIYQKGRCIIFDDFTLDSKRVERPFKVRSSAIKILTVRENMDFDFAFELLRTSKFPLLGHARHYITVVQPQAALIPHSLQEQQHIGKFFSTLDSLITAAEERTKHLRELKGSYLQRMFV
ncbi:restriction endonuclease subunit S [Pseudoscardovia radai]|uniref:restriction endonuclease subunit S n=1 Tax=Pseudoscardovia radai TaxID=987066 RepID=UPI00399189B6